MITREQVLDVVKCIYKTVNSVNDVTDDIMVLITEQDVQYRELVEAVLAWQQHFYPDGRRPITGKENAIYEAIQPFLPSKPSLSERLKSIAGGNKYGLDIRDELGELVEEAKQLENDLVLAIGYRS